MVTCFTYDANAEVYASCSVTWRNNYYVFGGLNKKRQISQIIGTQHTFIGMLTFDHYIAACSIMAADKIVLCFDYFNSKRCRVALNPLGPFNEIQLSNHEHRHTQTAASRCKWHCSLHLPPEIIKLRYHIMNFSEHAGCWIMEPLQPENWALWRWNRRVGDSRRLSILRIGEIIFGLYFDYF